VLEIVLLVLGIMALVMGTKGVTKGELQLSVGRPGMDLANRIMASLDEMDWSRRTGGYT